MIDAVEGNGGTTAPEQTSEVVEVSSLLQREEKIGERTKYSKLLSKEQDSKEKGKVDKEYEHNEKMKLELEISDLKRFRKEDHQTVGTLPTRRIYSHVNFRGVRT